MRGVYEPVGSNPDYPEHPLGVMLNELPLGTVLEAQTKHHTYHLENRGKGNVLISGHPTYCPEPVLVQFYRAGEGSPMFKFLRVTRAANGVPASDVRTSQHPSRPGDSGSRIREVSHVRNRGQNARKSCVKSSN